MIGSSEPLPALLTHQVTDPPARHLAANVAVVIFSAVLTACEPWGVPAAGGRPVLRAPPAIRSPALALARSKQACRRIPNVETWKYG